MATGRITRRVALGVAMGGLALPCAEAAKWTPLIRALKLTAE